MTFNEYVKNRKAKEGTIYMTDGVEYAVEFVDYYQDDTTITFVSDDGTVNIFSKFNMLCMTLKEKKGD